VCWEDAPEGSYWCGVTHPGQAAYTEESGAALAAEYDGQWGLDTKNGWRFCDMSLDECRDSCVAMGDCAEMSVASNGCCFVAKSTCDGTKRTNDDKYQVTACALPPSPPSAQLLTQPSSLAAPVCWEDAPEGSYWCGVTHPGQAAYTEESGAALAAEYDGQWGLDTKNGWRFCDMSLDECRDSCVAMGDCAEMSVASNGCCFVAKSTCDGTKRTNDDKYQTMSC